MADTPTTTTATTSFLPHRPSESLPTSFPPANPPATKTITRLTRTSFYASLVSLVFIVFAYLVTVFAPTNSYYFTYRLEQMASCIVFTAVLSFLNLSTLNFGPPPHTTPLLINLVLDFVLGFGVLAPSLRLFVDLVRQRWAQTCKYDWYPPMNGPFSRCWVWVAVVSSLLGICCVGGFIVGVSHLTLFIIRGMNTWRSRFWTRSFPWLAPAGGQVALEFNIRVIRPEAVAAGHVEGQRTGGMIEGRDEEEAAGEAERLVDV